jgi:hypothetical protein
VPSFSDTYHPSRETHNSRHSSRRPIEATMIQGTNINIGHANLNMTNHQISGEPRERWYGAYLRHQNCRLYTY